MPALLILLPLAVVAPDRPYPTMQACTGAAPAVARRRGRGGIWACVARGEGRD